MTAPGVPLLRIRFWESAGPLCFPKKDQHLSVPWTPWELRGWVDWRHGALSAPPPQQITTRTIFILEGSLQFRINTPPPLAILGRRSFENLVYRGGGVFIPEPREIRYPPEISFRAKHPPPILKKISRFLGKKAQKNFRRASRADFFTFFTGFYLFSV